MATVIAPAILANDEDCNFFLNLKNLVAHSTGVAVTVAISLIYTACVLHVYHYD